MSKRDSTKAIRRPKSKRLCPVAHVVVMPRGRKQGENPELNAEQEIDRQHMAYEVVRLERILLGTLAWRRTAEAKRRVAAIYEVSERTVGNALSRFRAEAEKHLAQYEARLRNLKLI